jgi:putative hemolysin
MMRITNGIIKLFGGKTSERQSFVTEEEIRTMINMGHEDGALESEEKKMIHNVFEFGDLKVSDVMTPRVDMIAVDVHSSYDETINRFDVHRFSRLPVYEGRVDNIIGVLYMKDLVFLNADSETFNIAKHMREPYFTYEYKQVTQLFHSMREHRIPMAIVIDEYGGTAGVVTLEDLVEEIVGDILDEYDEQEKEIEKIQENEYLVDGVTDIDTVNETLGVNIESEYFDSIGRFVTGLFGRRPEKGEHIEYNSITFIVDSKERNRIGKLRILAKGYQLRADC